MKLFNRNFVLCFLIQFWYQLAFHMTTPQIAQYVVLFGETTTLAGFIAGVFSIMAMVYRPFSGYAANRFHRKKVLAVGYVICIISFFGYAIAPNAYVVLAFRILHAAGLCIQTTLISVIAMDFIPKDRTAEGVGWVSIAATTGMGCGPVVGVALSGALGHRMAFATSGVLMLLTLFLLYVLPVQEHEPKPQSKLSIRSFIHVPSIPLAITMCAFATCLGLTTSLVVLMGDVRGIVGASIFLGIAGVGPAFVRPFTGRRVDKKGLNSVLPITFASETICMTLVAFASSLPMLLVATVFRIFGQGVAQPAIQGTVLKEAPPEERGTASSTFYMGIDIGQGFGAMIGGALADIFGFTATFMYGPCVLVVGLCTYLVWLRRSRSSAE